tara:strand:- start:243 stop:476 length:234 start_codon:yes stop_codon:yes gene_type:complete
MIHHCLSGITTATPKCCVAPQKVKVLGNKNGGGPTSVFPSFILPTATITSLSIIYYATLVENVASFGIYCSACNLGP